MGYEFQVTVDSEQPHEQAKWWASALGWAVEPSDEDFIRGLVAAGHAQESDTTTFEGVLVWKEGAAISDPEHPERPRVLFQLVPEKKAVKTDFTWTSEWETTVRTWPLISRRLVRRYFTEGSKARACGSRCPTRRATNSVSASGTSWEYLRSSV